MKILAIAGSLRSASINAALCRTVARLAPESVHVTVYGGLGALPLFNPDLESSPPATVTEFRGLVAAASALLIASPEYAHGISGVMKNALDWLVSFEGVVHKPAALINTSPRAHHALDNLREILRTMSVEVVEAASIALPLLGSCSTEAAMLESAQVSAAVRRILGELSAHAAAQMRRAAHFPVRTA